MMQTQTIRDHDLHLNQHASLRAFESWPGSGSPDGYFQPGIDAGAVEFYRENGFLVIENAFDAGELAALLAETVEICRGHRGDISGLPASGARESDDEVLQRVLCVHFPNKVSELVRRGLGHPVFVDVLTKIIGPNVKCMQSMLFIKGAGKPGQAWHQDEDFIPTRDRSLTGAWIALDDATVENGCLWAIPGSHRPGVLWPLRDHGDFRFDCAGESSDFPYTAADEIPLEMKAGSVVFFNGYLLHRSLPNRRSTGYRRSLVNHYMSAESLLPWFRQIEEGAHVANADYRDIVLIAGSDPHAWRGNCEIAKAHVRRTGEGGCGGDANNRPAETESDKPLPAETN